MGQPEQNPFRQIVRRGLEANINMPEGKYTIHYGAHKETGSPNPPDGIDGVSFEWASKYLLGDEINRAAILNQTQSIQYAKDHKIPLLAVDCSIPAVGHFEEYLGLVESFAAMHLSTKIRSPKKINRRDFLRTILVGGTALYLASPMVSIFGVEVSTVTGVGTNQSAETNKFTQKMHPEYDVFSLKLRDIVAAQKLNFLLKHHGYKHVFVTRGALHVGIEDAILSRPEKRLEFVERLKPVLLQALPYPETLYQIYEYKVSDEGKWEISQRLEEPNLKQIVEG